MKVYDILNAGPRHRFTVRGIDGQPLIVSNCNQSLARDILTTQTMEINKHYKVAGMVHDEVICVVPDDEVEEAKRVIQTIMRTSPDWAKDMPLDCEVGSGKTYGSAK